jgi:hypothetical protein
MFTLSLKELVLINGGVKSSAALPAPGSWQNENKWNPFANLPHIVQTSLQIL